MKEIAQIAINLILWTVLVIILMMSLPFISTI